MYVREKGVGRSYSKRTFSDGACQWFDKEQAKRQTPLLSFCFGVLGLGPSHTFSMRFRNRKEKKNREIENRLNVFLLLLEGYSLTITDSSIFAHGGGGLKVE